ncbi:unnamed protein product, partial [Rotaria socialis]
MILTLAYLIFIREARVQVGFCFTFEVSSAHIMDNLEISMKKQIQNELIRNRNSMIKEIRREIFEKLTYALRSQKV